MSAAKKNIGIDILPIMADFNKGAGISKYIKRLLKTALQLDKDNNYFLLLRLFRNFNFNISQLNEFKQSNVRFKKCYLPDSLQRKCWNCNVSAAFIEKLFYKDFEIYISTTYFTPKLKKNNVISFIYDITPLKLNSDYISNNYIKNYKILLKETITRSSSFIAISEFTKKDFIEYYKINSKKIHVIYPTVSEIFKPISLEDAKPVLNKYNIREKYILSVGNISKIKNTQGIVKAFSYLVKKYKISQQLVLVGKRNISDQVDQEIYRIIHNDNLSDRVIFTGYIPDNELPAIYSNADVFVFPSFYEGFGMPVLEALSCRVPCVTSNAASLPEVIGDAGFTVNPSDIVHIADSIYAIISNNNIMQELKEKAIPQSKKFSRIESAKKIVELINNFSG